MCQRWSKRFLSMAKELSTWSKDPSKQVGAIAVGKNNNVLATGYNGFPRGIKDDKRLSDREEKYKYVVHGEMNCIYNACHNGVSLDGATLYVYGLPVCSECAKGVIQVGIQKVIMLVEDESPIWEESFHLTKQMFNEAGVQYFRYDKDFNPVIS
jgi:dCMP deaminase